jgi:hypothetical protein
MADYRSRPKAFTSVLSLLPEVIREAVTPISNEKSLSLVAPVFNEVPLLEFGDRAFPPRLGSGVTGLDEAPIVGLNYAPR